MFWVVEQIEPIKINKTIKSNKTLWFYYKSSNIYIEKSGKEYKSICYKDNGKWIRVYLDTNVNFSARKDDTKLVWTRHKLGNQKIKTILYPKEFVEVDDTEIDGLLSTVIDTKKKEKPKQKLSDGWYQWIDSEDCVNGEFVEYILKSEGDILVSVYCETEKRFILNYHFQQKFYTMYEKLDESYKMCMKIFTDDLEEKLKKQFLI